MNLIKTSLYTSISTAVAFVSGFITIKVVAVKIGPTGIALLGQYQNTTALIALVGSAAIGVGLTKYLAEFREDQSKKKELITTAVLFVGLLSLFIGACVILLNAHFSELSFHSEKYRIIYVLYGSLLLLTCLNIVFAGILNGLKKINYLTISNVSASVVGLLFTVFLASKYGVSGVLIAGNVTTVVLFILNIVFLKKADDFRLKLSFSLFRKKMLFLLLKYSVVVFITFALIPLNQFFVRDFIIKQLSFTNAGYWQALTKISDYYLLFITTVLSVYFLPVLSETKNKYDIRKEIISGYKIILPAVALLATGIYLFRGLIIKILFTKNFSIIEDLFLFQLTGDFLKIGGWLLGYVLAAKAMLKTIITLEITFSILFILLTRYFVAHYGLAGSTYAFTITYAIYWLTTAVILRKTLYIQPQKF